MQPFPRLTRRQFLKAACLGASMVATSGSQAVSAAPARKGDTTMLPTPTCEQAAWQDMEIGMFFHFDIPVFTDLGESDWSKSGQLDPNLYNPEKLDTDQWMEAARAIGAKYTVFVAKHCSGFLSWQSGLYPYGVKQSRWRGGKGDVVRDYVESCRKYNIKPGIYASVSANAYWEVTNPGLVDWGRGENKEKQARYKAACEGMLAELWGNYGPLYEVWFDGGSLPPEQGGPDLIPILRKHQPGAMVFQGPAATIRWVGNEDGVADYPCWATTAGGPDAWGSGDPEGKFWLPAECDVPIRNHDWFWHPGAEHKLYSVEQLIDMYYRSAGRNCNLLINANIDRNGLVPDADFRRYQEFGKEIRARFRRAVASTRGTGSELTLTLPSPKRIDHVALMEDITRGERVREYAIEVLLPGSHWEKLCEGSCIGHKRIQRFPEVRTTAVRFRALRSAAEPIIRKMAVYRVGK
ncbi:MAG: alpha-L-fucosidase [Armatimonadetes bacterium]|nr:alpha-L-fucosidase [Armatimonadota bacterium]